MSCDRCGSTIGIPTNPLTGEPVRSRAFEAPGTPVTWPSAVLCARCLRELTPAPQPGNENQR